MKPKEIDKYAFEILVLKGLKEIIESGINSVADREDMKGLNKINCRIRELENATKNRKPKA